MLACKVLPHREIRLRGTGLWRDQLNLEPLGDGDRSTACRTVFSRSIQLAGPVGNASTGETKKAAEQVLLTAVKEAEDTRP
jgi:hypothetical protein